MIGGVDCRLRFEYQIGKGSLLQERWQHVWQTLRSWSLGEIWREFPPSELLMTVLALALLFVYLFVRDHHEGRRRLVWYGLAALFLLGCAIVLAQIF
jgi:hypothetical protein